MTVFSRIRSAFAGPPIDADGWFMAPMPELSPEWADPDEFLPDWAPESSRVPQLLTARPCAQWTHGMEHDGHRWQDAETAAPHACPGWRGEP